MAASAQAAQHHDTDLEKQFVAIWEEALDEYAAQSGESLSTGDLAKKKTFGEQLGISRKSTRFRVADMEKPATIEELLKEIERQNGNFAEFRNKRKMLFTALEKALIPIELLCNMTAGAASNIMPASCFAFGSVLYLARSAHGVSHNYDSICSLFEEIREFTTRLSVYNRDQISPELRSVITRLLVSIIRICSLASRLFNRGRVAHFLKTILEKDRAVAAEVNNLRGLVQTEQRIVNALTLNAASQTAHRVDDSVVLLQDTSETIRQFRNEVREQFTAVTSTLASSAEAKPVADGVRQGSLDKVKSVLRPSSTPEDIYRGIASARVPGTGDWIRTEPRFQSWLNFERPILWVSGGPGAGKSYVSSNIIQHLTEIYPQGVNHSSRTSVAYFFCKDYDPELRSFNKALRTLSYSICQNDPTYTKHVARICSFPDDLKTTRQIWQKLFIDYFREEAQNFQSKVFIVVDGLDEVPDEERRAFLELLQDFQEYSSGEPRSRVQVILVGRPELNFVMDEILGEDIPMITVSAMKNSNDINRYVRTKVARMPVLRRASKELQAEITAALTEKADGMFLWVDLMLREIAKKRSELQIRKALSTAPQGINNTIRVVLERFSHDLDDDGIEDLNALLMWITCAQRPFTLSELEELMRLRSPDGKGMIYLEGELRKRFASFFSVNREDGRSTEELQAEKLAKAWEEELELPMYDDDTICGTTADLDDDLAYDATIESDPDTTEVTLAHASIGEYFRSGVYGKETAVGVDMQESQIHITKQLLAIVCDLEPLVSDKWYNSSLGLYACDRWQEHLALIDLSKTRAADKIAIGSYILQVFFQVDVTRRWIAQASMFEVRWLYDESPHILVRNWLTDPDVFATLDINHQMRVSELGNSGKNLLSGAMAIAGFEWLTRYGWIATNLCYWIRAYVTATQCSREGKPWPKQYEDLSKESAQAIRAYAKSARLEEDATWHNRVGLVLREVGFYEDAIQEFQAALREDPNSWHAHAYLAWVYGDCCSWRDAISSAQKALDILHADKSLIVRNKQNYETLIKKYAHWENSLNNKERALDSYRRALSHDPSDGWSVTEMLKILASQKDYAGIVELLKELEAGISIEKGCSRLVDLCINSCSETNEHNAQVQFCDGVTLAARATNGLDVLKKMYLSAINVSRRSAKATTVRSLQTELALLYYRGYEDDAKAMSIWETVIRESERAKPGTYLHQVRSQATMWLCKAYVGTAIRGGVGSEAYKTSVKKLEALCKAVRGTGASAAQDFDWRRDDIFNSTINSTLSLGLLYRLSGREAEARACFVPHMQLGIDLVGDKDEANHFQGFGKMAETFLHAGDDINTIAAYSRFGLPDAFCDDGEVEQDIDDDDDELVIVEKADAQPPAEDTVRVPAAASDDAPPSAPQNADDKNVDSNTIILMEKLMEKLTLSKEQGRMTISRQSTADTSTPSFSFSRQATDVSTASIASTETATSLLLSVNPNPPSITTQTATQPQPQPQPLPAPLPLHGIIECDGGCSRSFPRPNGANLCRYCIDTAFCDDCLALLRRGEIALRVCDGEYHDWLRVPERSGKLKDGMVWVSGRQVQMGEWLEGVRRDWGL